MKYVCPIVGTKYHAESVQILASLKDDQPLDVVREPDNPADGNAIKIMHESNVLGYVPAYRAREIAPLMDAAGLKRAVGVLNKLDGKNSSVTFTVDAAVVELAAAKAEPATK